MSGETYGNRYWISQLQNFLHSWQPILSLFSIFLNLLIHLSKHQEWEALYSPPLYLVSLKSMSVQGAPKGAIYQLTKTSACERAKDNIRSNAVAPRYISTSMVEQINNVGTNIWKPTVDYTAEEFSTVMTTNLESACHLCQLAHPLLKASGVGSIVCISSIAGVVALNVGSIYGASKGAINQLTKDLACEWAKTILGVIV